MIAYPNSPFHEDTLKDQLQDALKDLKVDTFDEHGIKKVFLQFNEVFAQLKAMDNHSTRNVLKRRQDFVD